MLAVPGSRNGWRMSRKTCSASVYAAKNQPTGVSKTSSDVLRRGCILRHVTCRSFTDPIEKGASYEQRTDHSQRHTNSRKGGRQGWVTLQLPTGRLPTRRSASRTAGPTARPAWGRRSRSMRKRFQTCIASYTGFSASAMSSSLELALQGTHKGPLPTPMESSAQPGKRMAPRAVTSSAL